MKNTLSAMLFAAVLGCMHSAVFAAELIDVKPVVSGSVVSIQISADIAMTYTYYKVPGQARAVVDIAEADPEKVEPLIVVNKGVVSSISVDKALISGIVVSRIIFNLVSESDIYVTATPDRKLLSVTFGVSPAAGNMPEPKPESKLVQPPEPVVTVVPPVIVAETPPSAAHKEEDPLGLDETAPKPALPKDTAAVSVAPLPIVPTEMPVPKLEPVVPVSITPAPATALTIKEITTGASYIEIRANQPITDYKTTRITGPERLIIDITGTKINQKAKTVSINKFGITKARIGVSPKRIRIVIDCGKAGIPIHTITKTGSGLRINFL